MWNLPTFFRRKNTTPQEDFITVDLCKEIPELFNAEGQNKMEKALKEKSNNMNKQLDTVEKAVEKKKNAIKKQRQPKIEKLEKKTDGFLKNWKKLQAEAAKAETDYRQSQKEFDIEVAAKDNEEVKLAELEHQKKDLEEKKHGVADEVSLFESLIKTKMEDRPLGANNNPESEDLLEAVQDKVTKIADLVNMIPTRQLEILNFLRLLGEKRAMGDYKTKPQVLRRRLTQLLFPNDCPKREPSLSPDSKAKKIADMIWKDADEAEAQERKEQQEQRKREREEFSTPAAKKAKPSADSPGQVEFLRTVLSPEDFEKYLAKAKGTDSDGDDDDDDDKMGTSPRADDEAKGTSAMLDHGETPEEQGGIPTSEENHMA